MDEYITKSAALAVFGDIHPLDYNTIAYTEKIKAIPAADVVDRQALMDKVTEVAIRIRKWNGSHFTTKIIRVIPEEALLEAPAVIPREAE